MASAKRSPGDNIYIPIPGDTSGDLWHLAAAQILSFKYGQDRKFIVPVVGLPVQVQKLNENERRMQDKSYSQGQSTFDYLTKIGLECLLMLVRVGEGATSRENLEKVMWYTTNEQYDQLYQTQQAVQQQPTFASLVPSLTPIVVPPGNLKEIWCPRTDRVVHLRTATTIAMSYLEPVVSRNGRLKYLAGRMYSQNPDVKDMAVEAAAQKKKQKLDELITKFQKGKVYPRIVLENWRIGEVNRQTNSNTSIGTQLQSLVDAVGPETLAIIRVTAVPDQQSIDKADWPKYLDIYGKQGNPDDPGLDPRAQSRFWNLVSQDPRVVGLFGGRSGSVDIAAFSGMTCFFWDEPWLPFVAGVLDDPIMTKMNEWKNVSFVSQTLRSLELSPVMSIGVAVERDNEDNWKRIDETALAKWLHSINNKPPNVPYNGEIWPGCVPTVKWRNKTLTEHRQWYLEKRSIGIVATVLDRMNYKDEKPYGAWQK
ncbi:hypothetical protein MMC26_005177 [Xylographa opegraphella]|nr:hypothetical protein [Xylographa opegraphella]